MKVTAELLKSVIARKGYVWYEDRPNLIGIRTTLQVPDIFNDLFVAAWKQPLMPVGLSTLDQQKWLNSYLYVGKYFKPLKEDGVAGGNTTFAIASYEATKGTVRIKSWTITTDPGTYYLNHPLNTLGTAVLKPNQYVGVYQLGFHQWKPDHPALIQTGGKVEVYRDGDLDNVAEEQGAVQGGSFGINIHRSNSVGTTPNIGKWSAGCQVFQVKTDHEQLLKLCRNYEKAIANKFTYTLLREADLA